MNDPEGYLGDLMAELSDVRHKRAKLADRERELRDQILDASERMGLHSFVAHGLRLTVKRETRWEYDPEKLHELECIRADEFADALQTTIDKRKIQELIDSGTIAWRDVEPARVPKGEPYYKVLLDEVPMFGNKEVK